MTFPPIPNAKTIESLIEQRSDLLKEKEALQARVRELEAERNSLLDMHSQDIATIADLQRQLAAQ